MLTLRASEPLRAEQRKAVDQAVKLSAKKRMPFMGVKKKKKVWAVSEKLEVVQAREQGMRLEDVSRLYGISGNTVSNWAKKYQAGGIAGLEPAPTGGAARRSARVEAAAEALKEVTAANPEIGVGKAQGALYRQLVPVFLPNHTPTTTEDVVVWLGSRRAGVGLWGVWSRRKSEKIAGR